MNAKIHSQARARRWVAPLLACIVLAATQARVEAATTTLSSVLAAASCSAADVASALAAAPDGATVEVPASGVQACQWDMSSGNLTLVDGRYRYRIVVGKSVWLKGAGKDQTRIKLVNAPTTEDIFALGFNCAGNGSMRVEVSGMSIEGVDNDSMHDSGVHLYDDCRDFKIHDMRLTRFRQSAIEVRGGNSRGVIYRNELKDNVKLAGSDTGEGYGVVVYGSHTWPAMDFGGPEAVYIEDNAFSGNRHSIASNYGSRYVARYNTIVTTNLTRETSMVDAHGWDPDADASSNRGSRGWEIYDNTLSMVPGTDDFVDGIQLKGGSGVVFDNAIGYGIAYATKIGVHGGCPSGSGYIKDQIDQVWIWNNTREDPNYGVELVNTCPNRIIANTHYFLAPKPGYEPYTYPHPLRGSDIVFQNGFE